MLQRFLKPWLVYQPSRVFRRAIGRGRPVPGYAALDTSWGARIIADPAKSIGYSILTTGVYDIAVSEALARLITPGDTVVDAGTNVGYMTVLAGAAAGPAGRVLSFEPHPALYEIARRNVEAARGTFAFARSELHQTALGDTRGTADLLLPPDFEGNDGVASITRGGPAAGTTVAVPIDTLDDVLAGAPVAVMKLDVEGFEPQVLKGAAGALAGRRIRHIVFEDHDVARSEVVQILRAAGYELFSLGWSLRGPRIQPIELGPLARSYEAASYLATIASDELKARLQRRGWLVLRRSFARRGS